MKSKSCLETAKSKQNFYNLIYRNTLKQQLDDRLCALYCCSMIKQTDQADSSLAGILDALEKPLLFAAKNDCAYLHTLKGLDELIPRLAGSAYDLVCRT